MRRMRSGLAVHALLTAVLAAGAAKSAAAAAARVPGTLLAQSVSASQGAVERALAKHPLRMLDGSRTTLSSLAGRVVVVNFWATWCRPCLRELPALAAIQTEMADRGGTVIAISIDQDRRNVERFAKVHSIELAVAHDGPEGLARELDLKQVPLTLVLDRSGAVAWCSSRTDEAGLAETRAAIERLLATPVPPRSEPASTAGDMP